MMKEAKGLAIGIFAIATGIGRIVVGSPETRASQELSSACDDLATGDGARVTRASGGNDDPCRPSPQASVDESARK